MSRSAYVPRIESCSGGIVGEVLFLAHAVHGDELCGGRRTRGRAHEDGPPGHRGRSARFRAAVSSAKCCHSRRSSWLQGWSIACSSNTDQPRMRRRLTRIQLRPLGAGAAREARPASCPAGVPSTARSGRRTLGSRADGASGAGAGAGSDCHQDGAEEDHPQQARVGDPALDAGDPDRRRTSPPGTEYVVIANTAEAAADRAHIRHASAR